MQNGASEADAFYAESMRLSREPDAANATLHDVEKLLRDNAALLAALEWLYTDATDRGETTDDEGQPHLDWEAARQAIAQARGEG